MPWLLEPSGNLEFFGSSENHQFIQRRELKEDALETSRDSGKR